MLRKHREINVLRTSLLYRTSPVGPVEEDRFINAAEIEPDWVHPGLGLSVHQMLNRILELDDQQEIQKLEM